MERYAWPMYVLLAFSAIFFYAAAILATNSSFVYLWLLVPGFILAVFGYLSYRRHHTYKLLTKLRENWGLEQKKKERSFAEIASLFELSPEETRAIDDRTWRDLDMDEIFAKLDRTLTSSGQQCLYQILRTPYLTNSPELRQRSDLIDIFKNDSKQREAVCLELSKITSTSSSGLTTLLWGSPAIEPMHSIYLYRILALLALLSPGLLILDIKYVFVILLLFQVNMYFHFNIQKKIKAYFEGVRSLGQLISVGKRIGALSCPDLSEILEEIDSTADGAKHFSNVVRFVGIEATDPLLHTFQQYISILYLAEVRGFFKAVKFIENHRGLLQRLFLLIGEIDALQSIASYRSSLDYYVEPKFVQRDLLKIIDAYHPLLERPVSNSVTVTNKGILVTGSNMSGKSTFLRTVGVNVLFAQTIATCLCKEYLACPVQLLSSIGRSDNVVEGKSYYLEEALGVKRILDALTDEVQTLAIFDELYRGTNSEERIFAAKRVLEYLNHRKALVFIATHDLELADLLENSYTSVHFSERVGVQGLEFDYKLKEGPATTKNAIALLRYLKYPLEITE